MTHDQKILFEKYFKLTQEWGRQINLTANLSSADYMRENRDDPAQAFHAFLDWAKNSIAPDFLSPKSFADFGCGGGYVGITWHILFEQQCQTILVDADRKKTNFCKEVIRSLNLKNISAIQERVGSPVHGHMATAKFDLIVSRATWAASDFFSLSTSYLAPSGILVAFQSEKQFMDNTKSPITENGHKHWISYECGDLPRIKRYLLLRKDK